MGQLVCTPCGDRWTLSTIIANLEQGSLDPSDIRRANQYIRAQYIRAHCDPRGLAYPGEAVPSTEFHGVEVVEDFEAVEAEWDDELAALMVDGLKPLKLPRTPRQADSMRYPHRSEPPPQRRPF